MEVLRDNGCHVRHASVPVLKRWVLDVVLKYLTKIDQFLIPLIDRQLIPDFSLFIKPNPPLDCPVPQIALLKILTTATTVIAFQLFFLHFNTIILVLLPIFVIIVVHVQVDGHEADALVVK